MDKSASNRIPQLTLITDSSRYAGDTFFDAVYQSLEAGVEAVLVREKTLTSAKLLALAARLRTMTTACAARLIIHTQADVAAAVDADGVHLAAGDIGSTGSVRQWLNDPAKTVSVSCHCADELAAAAQAGADFVFLSPVFPTASHPGAAHLGLDNFKLLAAQSSLPVVALGGITEHNCAGLKGYPLAVIAAILGSDAPAAVTRGLLGRDHEHGGAS